jgi:hypothetical protein
MWTILVIATAIEIAFALLRCISPVLALSRGVPRCKKWSGIENACGPSAPFGRNAALAQKLVATRAVGDSTIGRLADRC